MSSLQLLQQSHDTSCPSQLSEEAIMALITTIPALPLVHESQFSPAVLASAAQLRTQYENAASDIQIVLRSMRGAWLTWHSAFNLALPSSATVPPESAVDSSNTDPHSATLSHNEELPPPPAKTLIKSTSPDFALAIAKAQKIMDKAFMLSVYERYADSNGELSAPALMAALKEVDAPVLSNDLSPEEIFRRVDSDLGGTVGFDEFMAAAQLPDELEMILQEENLSNSAPTIRVCIGSAVGHISLLSDASEELLCEALEASFSLQKFRLLRLLGRVKHAVSAKAVIQEKVGQDPEKFSIRTMATGSIDDFHIGLRDRIGSPNLDFFKAMRAEHMTRGGHDFTFITRNYELTTQACREWLYVVGDENGNRIEPPASSMGSGRVIHSIDMLLQKPLAQAAKLIREEMIAIVMYTGPAFVLYNAVLRQFPHDIYTVFKDSDNLFPTTIFVLVSAVNKLSRCMNIPPSTLLYRGLGGTLEFPDRFSQPDHKCMTPNALGFLEYGFMSTTANKSIAVQYSGVQQGTPKATILQIRPNTVDRGADISQFSQYPLEREFLFAPYSFVQSDGPQRTEVTDGGGVLTAVPVRVNVNLKSETVEELKEKKKQLHLSSAHAIVEEVRHELWEWAASSEAQDRLQEDHSYLRTDAGEAMTTFTLAAEIVRQCEAVTARHLQAPLGDYVDDGSYRALVNEILDIKAWAKEAKELWMLDMSQQIVELQGDEDPPKPLRQCHRLWQTYLRRILDEVAPLPEKQASLSVKLLISRGLVKRGVHGPEEMNADGEDVLVQAGGDGWPTSDIVAAVAAGADVFAADAKGCSGLWNSAQYGHVGTMAALIAAKCNPNQCSHDDVSPIWIAAQDGHAECLALLIEAKGDVNKRHDKGASPAYIAAQEGRLACLKMLVDAGCDINKSDHNGMSPIVIASYCGHADCVSLLLASGARDTRKALSIAYSQGQTECARILEEAAGN